MSDEPRIIEFFVPGRPQQKGSKTAIPRRDKLTGKYLLDFQERPIIDTIDANRKSPKWMKHVKKVSIEKMLQATPLQGPVKLSARFYFSRILKHYLRRKSGDILRDDAPHWHTSTPDQSKLIRAIEDAMSGVVYGDDRQIAVYGLIEKVYTEKSEGVLIRVESIDDPGPQTDLCRVTQPTLLT